MKVRFYCDVPIHKPGSDTWLMATSKILHHCLASDVKRIAFDVDFPPNVLIEVKESGIGIVSNVAVITERDE